MRFIFFIIFALFIAGVKCAQWRSQVDSLQMCFDASHNTDNIVVTSGYDNGLGSAIRISTDNGAGFIDATFGKVHQPPFIWTSHFTNETHGVIGGTNPFYAGIDATTDGGVTWKRITLGGKKRMPNSVRQIREVGGNPHKLIAVGNWMKTHGIAISNDDGFTWTDPMEVGDSVQAQTIGGSFPSDNTWYVVTGHLPESTVKRHPTKQMLYDHIKFIPGVRMHEESGQVYFDCDLGDDPTHYYASIMKTTDAGKTWKKVFESEQTLLGRMDCVDENSCWVTAGGYGVNSTQSGQILHTSDGGANWEEQFSTDSGRKIIFSALNMVSPTEGWAVYGNAPDGEHVVGQFLHTTDGGKTWNKDIQSKNWVPTTCGFSNPNSGWCACIPGAPAVKTVLLNYNN